MYSRIAPILVAIASLFLIAELGSAQSSFVEFESGPVRPITLSPSGNQLFVVNTPDNRLEVFSVSGGNLTHTDSIPVGMEPVAVAARNNNEIWVVNHLSDSVSIIDLTATPAKVVRTLLVGDEPRDIVFAGTSGNRAFITTAHRGQHRTNSTISGVTGAGDPQLTTEGIGRADVWVFNAATPGAAFGGTPVEILTFFSDTPRALAVSGDGNTVYVAAFHSGNQTTVINETVVSDGFGGAGQVPNPDQNIFGAQAPETGVIVKFDGAAWRDAANFDWTSSVNFNLPDHDVFAVNANTLTHGTVFDSVGTILFNMVVNPSTGMLYVMNTELPNDVRFEGPGTISTTVQGPELAHRLQPAAYRREREPRGDQRPDSPQPRDTVAGRRFRRRLDDLHGGLRLGKGRGFSGFGHRERELRAELRSLGRECQLPVDGWRPGGSRARRSEQPHLRLYPI
ncbi:MAG: hypothetical protein JRG94_08355 [Deltaproteobacteria bacterium]|nr:hypothetical protein [Deltaproteobacteria bacterium]